ncbi:DUF4097 family beta strand repeat-containing protein [Streptomyces sp. DSM 40750]|uniref:DUF4097 family beta strand repeat-containing protein n=1 Tax=Streptomyces sp. DSM 40750 TaxID=2801030 RepID=UPI00214C519E|nr:DUF4097 family beta strand repeat-containing protein [Streptomyces sp. DSM 40750]UUU24875.1 DUF4097 family beta strand repeat-containing protein [Streptomyces sp. DSM 40750]
MSEWCVAEPRKLTFDEPVTTLHVHVVNGTVNVVGTDEGSARLEVSDVEGPPLTVTQRDGTLTVAYDDLPWNGFLKWLDRKGRRRDVLVSLAVPTGTRVEVGVVGATAVVSGLHGRTEVKGISGDTTLVGLSGPVRATTVSGNVEAQALTGDLRLSSVSGDLTVVEGSCATVKADSVSGSIILDLGPMDRPTDVGLTSVSGEIAIRLPHSTDAEVEANTAGGTISHAFDGLRVSGPWGAHKVTGRLGTGDGRLKATTVTGSIALLRRPPAEDEPWDEGPWAEEPGSGGDSPALPTDSSVPPIIPSTATSDSPNSSGSPDSSDSPDSCGSPDGSVGRAAPAVPADASPEGSGAGSDDGGPGGTTPRTTDKKVF